MSKTTKFNIGDIVVLKSGGPPMTIKGEQTSIKTKLLIGYYCQWFAGKKIEEGDFPAESLMLAPKDEKP